MLSIARKSEDFKQRIKEKFNARISKLKETDKEQIAQIKEIEDERENIMKAFEEELKMLELKYDQRFNEVNKNRHQKLQSCREATPNFWMRVLSNHKITKDFIAEEDKDALKSLRNIATTKLDDGNSFRISFEFDDNEYFNNRVIEKTYHVCSDLHIDRIESSPIEWKEGKCLTLQKKVKNVKNKNTGEKKSIEVDEPTLSFFNFFTNLRMPNEEEIKTLAFDVERDLGSHLDLEYEIGIELIDEIIPYATEYFVGITHETEEYSAYVNERMMENEGKSNKNNKK